MSKLKGKVALVTGASKGIGASVAKGLAAAGASVVVNYASSRAGAEKVVAEITTAGGKAVAVGGNIAKPAEIIKLLAETKKAFGGLDILVNNAGVYKFEPLEAVTAEEFHRQFDTNVLGPILASQEAAKLMPRGGSIINISSVASVKAMPGSVVYAATKSALDTVTRVLAVELGPRGIRVNTLAPGGVETEGTHTAGIIGGDMEKYMVSQTPLGRIGQPDDIARAVVFLASDDAAWITGDRITASGGL
jgi:3-oxoacyl-[acyl-carrier protein] reductase